MNFLTADEILEQMNPGDRVAFVLRHGERRHITDEDTDFGIHVPLTPEGERQSFLAGEALSIFKGKFFFGASPVFRCRQTAALVAEGCGVTEYTDPEKVPGFKRLGEFYVNDYENYHRHLREGFYPAICRFVELGNLPGFMPHKQGSEEFVQFMLDNSQTDVNVFCSHDAWIVPLLSYYTDLRFTPTDWLNFLSGVAVLFDVEKKNVRVLPVSLMPDGGHLHFWQPVVR